MSASATPDRFMLPDTLDTAHHPKPYVRETLEARAMHFSISETQSRMHLKHPDALTLEYTRTMMGFLLFKPRPQRIAMIGLGGGSIAKFCHRHLPAAHMTTVEINPHVIALRDQFDVPPDGPRFRVICGDGAAFVRESTERFDVLLVDGFDREGQPPALCSQRFYDDCADVLAPDGLLVANLHTGHKQFDELVERIRHSFGGSALVVDDGECSNSIVFAGKGGLLARQPVGPVRCPPGLDAGTWAQLMPACARVVSALQRMRS